MLRTKRFFATLFAVSLMAVGFTGPASGQVAVQDGLVNVAIGDVEVLNDARIGVAAVVAANVLRRQGRARRCSRSRCRRERRCRNGVRDTDRPGYDLAELDDTERGG